MTRQELSQWWARRGDAWDKIGGAERSLLETLQLAGDADLDQRVRDALGCLSGARELLWLATERLHVLAVQFALDVADDDGECAP